MADHVNIQQIERFDSGWDNRLAFDKLKAELDIMTKRFEQAQSNLDAIFTRIARGDDVALHYRRGEVIRIARVPEPETPALADVAPSGAAAKGPTPEAKTEGRADQCS